MPNRINKRRLKHVIINFTKYSNTEKKMIKAARQQKGKPIRLTGDFSTEILQVRKWHDKFKVLNEKNLQPRILYPVRSSFIVEGGIKSFPDKQN